MTASTVRYEFDVVVVGAGHAGTEAATAAARMGAKVALLTGSLDTVGQMSCNPAIGGVAKGQIVREIDALGGLMGQAIDATGIQFRMLNRRKGPAMHSPRAQADKKAYQQWIKETVEAYPGVSLIQEIVEDLVVDQDSNGQMRISGYSGFAATHCIKLEPWCLPLAPSFKPSCTPAKPRLKAVEQGGYDQRHQCGFGSIGNSTGPLQDRYTTSTKRQVDQLCCN